MVPRVLIVGGGFGGLECAKQLERSHVAVTLVDRLNHHLFQPLLYQVAMAGLSPAEIAVPIRSILRTQKNVQVLLGEVVKIDLAKRRVEFRHNSPAAMEYDYLVLAAGAQTNYFGNPEWAKTALGLKDLDDAIEIRRRVLVAFEAAEREENPTKRAQLLTFVVIGGGPTGVELAGAIAELSRTVLARDFRRIDPSSTKVMLLEAGPRILTPFDEVLGQSAIDQLKELGVEVRTGMRVTKIDERGVQLGEESIAAATVIWAAGVRGAPIAETLGVELDRAKRVVVNPDCTIPNHPNAFVIGDLAAFIEDGKPLPGVSPVAMQQARHVAEQIERAMIKAPLIKFKYFDKGSMATIGRSRAIAQMGKLRLSGFIAWLAWLLVHIWYLIGFKNRFFVLVQWAWSYMTFRRGARLITGHVLAPPMEALPPPAIPEKAQGTSEAAQTQR